MPANESKELLEEIRTKARLDYMSDLHVKHYAERVREAIEEIPEDTYDESQWRAAVAYILRLNPEESSSAGFKRLICKALK